MSRWPEIWVTDKMLGDLSSLIARMTLASMSLSESQMFSLPGRL